MRRSLISSASGFSLLELIAALAIAGFIMALAVPSSVGLFESVRYRESVRDVVTLMNSARYEAAKSGTTIDVAIDPQRNEIRLGKKLHTLPEDARIAVSTAAELSTREIGVIRFYPEGGTSGGTIKISREDGSGVNITVDWLVGRVTQTVLDG